VKLFLAVRCLLPSYGGPAHSVSRLAAGLASAGIDVGLWACDQSAATSPLLRQCSRVTCLTGTARQALKTFVPDVIHDNGMWLPHNHALATFAFEERKPLVVSTRGMLEPWARRHKGFKKLAAWYAYQRRDLTRAACLHATGGAEARNLENLSLGVPIVAIPNGVDLPGESSPRDHSRGESRMGQSPRTALFLGRIYPIKGLPMLVEAWARARPAGWVLRIIGPDEAGHRHVVERAVRAAGLEEVVSFSDPIDSSNRATAFSQAELFVLPSHSESFGLVVAEALAHGLPVLTTTGAPWSVLMNAGCGWWVDTSIEGIAEGLRAATSLSPGALASMGAKGRALVSDQFSWDKIVGDMTAVYERALTKSSSRGPWTSARPLHHAATAPPDTLRSGTRPLVHPISRLSE
jgi:glycosyltransferase involved in cell wall biosynthesis